MTYSFRPRGICAQEIIVDIDELGVIQDLRIVGGCDGNHKGLAALVKGMRAQEAMERLSRAGFIYEEYNGLWRIYRKEGQDS